jgi:hypothetical protein
MSFTCNPPNVDPTITDTDIINYLNLNINTRTMIETAVMEHRHSQHTVYCSSPEYVKYSALSPDKKKLVQTATSINNLCPIVVSHDYYDSGILKNVTEVLPYIVVKDTEPVSILNQILTHNAKFNVKMEKYVTRDTGVTLQITFEVQFIDFMGDYLDNENVIKAILSHINFDVETYKFSEKNVEWEECDGDQGRIKYKCTDPTVHTFFYIVIDDIRSYFTDKLETDFDIVEPYDEDIKHLIINTIDKFKDCPSILSI